jgi:diguanylate cyclase (GGDEF)-like protein
MCLVLASSVLVVSTVWFLPASAADRRSAVTPATLVAIAAVLLWLSSLPRRRSFLLAGYPILVFLSVATVGADTASLGTSYVGLFTLSFVYVGLTMPRNTAVGLAPLAAVCWWTCNRGAVGAANGVLIVRLTLALVVWIGVAELLARRTRTARAESGRLIRAAGRDPLTGLDNRRGLDTLLDDAAPGDALVLLDLDHFKNVNDAHGHAVGDLVLTDFAGVVTRQLRGDDTAIRYGGEEVLLHLPQTPISHVGHVLARLRDAWADIAPLTTFSAGAAMVADTGHGRTALLLADKNLYLAKANGRDQAVL